MGVAFVPPTELGRYGSRYWRHPGPFVADEPDLARLVNGWSPVLLSGDLQTPREKGALEGIDLALLTSLVVCTRPSLFLEIGTFDGRTALHVVALNPKGRVITIDLPEVGSGGTTYYGTDALYFERSGAASYLNGAPPELLARIVQLRVDSTSSAAFAMLADATGGAAIDFALIDGAHDYDSVRSDFEELVLPSLAAGGIVLFHDYGRLATHVGVTNYLSDAARVEGYVFYWPHLAGQPTNTAMFVNLPATRNYAWRDVSPGLMRPTTKREDRNG